MYLREMFKLPDGLILIIEKLNFDKKKIANLGATYKPI